MGDRGNIVIDNGTDHGIALYSHWGGSDLPAVLARALARGRGRFGDDPYLTRVIFSEMIKGDIEGTTGFGIEAFESGTQDYTEAGSGDIVVDLREQQVSDGDGTWYSFEKWIEDNS